MSNPFKSSLKERAQIGLWLSLANAYSAEVCATASYDWLLIDGEHAPNNVQTTLQQLQAVAPYAAQPVVRAVTADVPLIKQLLDIGVQNLLVPMIDTPEQALEMVRATRYPPDGIRGVGAAVARASRWGLNSQYLDQANDDVCLLVQAETRIALGHLDAICAVEGVDGVFIGPADLAASLGHRGNPTHPEVQAAIDNAIRTIVRSGKAAGILTGDVKLAKHYLALGARFVAVGIDVTLLAQSSRKLLQEFR
jgi:4-hydroxy-2-oxoheptanedioate aldolase